MKKHRNSQKRIIFEDAVYFVTSKTHNNYPYFRERVFCPPERTRSVRAGDLFVENLRLCKRLKGFLLYGWVLNYDHFHSQIQPNDEWNISKVMQFLKRHISRDINYVMGYNNYDHHYSGGDIRECRLQGGMYKYFRPIIKKHDKKLNLLKSQFQQKYSTGHPFPKFRWKKTFHDEYIRNDKSFDNLLGYIEYNPDKHGLPPNWPYIYTNPKYEDLTDE